MKKLIKNVYTGGALCDILVEDGLILSVEPAGGEYPDAPAKDFGGARIYPGLIDIHSHGAIGIDMASKYEDLGRLADWYLAGGTTTWYPTVTTTSRENFIGATSQNIDLGHGANIPGFHFEGPFLCMKYKGAQNPDYIIPPDLSLIDECKNVKLITVAPENEGAIDFIREMRNRGVVVALGHTDAGYDIAREAFEAGASSITHTFNAMKGVHHRDPGAIGAGADCGAYAQVISDGIHLHPSVVRMLYKLYGRDRVTLISDTIEAAGMADGIYDLAGLSVTVEDGVARLTVGGNLAGSTTPLFKCVKTAIGMGIPEEDADYMASTAPARLMGLNKGVIAPGYDADFIIVDGEFNLVTAIARGEFEADE